MKARHLSPLNYKKTDEHFQLLIGDNLALCQATQKPIIDKAQQTANRAHERIDCHETRLNRLDDEKIGQVTILWAERNKVIGIALILLALIIVNLFISGNGKFDKSALKAAIKESLAEISK